MGVRSYAVSPPYFRRGRGAIRLFVALALGVGLWVHGSLAWAQNDLSSCTPATSFVSWSSTDLQDVGGAANTGAASAPATDTPFIPPGRLLKCSSNTQPCGRAYFAKGKTLYSFEDRGTTGLPAWRWTLPTVASPVTGETAGITLDNFPSATPQSSGVPLVVYLGGANGRLYKLDAQNGCDATVATRTCVDNMAPLLVKDLRRKDGNGALVCNPATDPPPADGIGATPAVLLNVYGGTLFQNFASDMGHGGADLVFVMTRNGCEDRTHNAIYALWSDNFAQQWVYQGSDGGDKVDAFTEGCLIRYPKGPRGSGMPYNNRDANDPLLFCGSKLNQDASGQDSLFVLNPITTNPDLRVLWSHNAGSLENRPMLNTHATWGERLYVANEAGTIHAYGPEGDGGGGPDLKWSLAAAPDSTFKRSPWIEPRGGNFKDKILVLDVDGVLRAFQDDGSVATPAFAPTAALAGKWVSLAVVLPGVSSKAYLGRNDGFLQQVDLATGAPQGKMQIDTSEVPAAGLTPVFDPSLDVESANVFALNRGYAVDTERFKRFKFPFCFSAGGGADQHDCSQASDCNSSWSEYNPCVAIPCDNGTGGTGKCYYAMSQYVPVGAGNVLNAPDGTACDDGRSCTSAPTPPAPIPCTVDDQCQYVDNTPQSCACAAGAAGNSHCQVLGPGGPCNMDSDCTDPKFRKCSGVGGTCQALCAANTNLALSMNGLVLPQATISVAANMANFPPSGTIRVTTSLGVQTVTYTGITGTTSGSFTGCTGGTGTMSSGGLVQQNPIYSPFICANCSPTTVRTRYSICVGGFCRCNRGAGINCNDICIAGRCTGTNNTNCPCVKPGDQACASGSTCCGALYGGCVDLTDNPQHCGACQTDCGSYTDSNVVCNENSDCDGGGFTSCANDGDCQSRGINSKCIEGHCGKCSKDCSCFYNQDCDQYDGVNAGVCTGASWPTTLGVCDNGMGMDNCVGVCRRLTSTGNCFNGICTTCGGGGQACSCNFPSVGELSSLSPAGTSAIAFERKNAVAPATTQVCGAYLSTYNDSIGGSLQRLPLGGPLEPYTSADATPLNGVAVPQSGFNVFGNFANPGPGMALRPNASTTYSKVSAANVLPSGTLQTTIGAGSNGQNLPQGTINVASTAAFPHSGGLRVTTSGGQQTVVYTGKTGTSFTGCTGGTGTMATGGAVSADNPYRQTKLNEGPVGPALDYTTFIDGDLTSRVAYFGNWFKIGDVVKVQWNGATWVVTNLPSAYKPSATGCGGVCGAANMCDVNGSKHCGGGCPAGTTCVGDATENPPNDACRCNAPTSCAGGTCVCPAPSVCSAGACACPGPTEACSAGICTCNGPGDCGPGKDCINSRCSPRVTAIALENLEVLNTQTPSPPKVKQRHLFIGHGAVLSIFNLVTNEQTDVDLAKAYVPAPSTNERTVTGILAIAVHPQYGDILVEVRGSNNFRYLLNVDRGDHSCRHELTVQKSLQKTQTPDPLTKVPDDFGPDSDGRLQFMPDGMLMRFAPVVNGKDTTSFKIYKVTK